MNAPESYSTITDVILHVRYGGSALASTANNYLKQLPPPSAAAGDPTPSLALPLRLPYDFPNDWYAFTIGGSTAHFAATLTMD